jgi:Competence protein CoiA-like family
MPFHARIGGKIVMAEKLCDTEWRELQISLARGVVQVDLPCCGGLGHLRMRKKTRHFAHNPTMENCCPASKGESEAHHQLKWKIHEICEQVGYKSRVGVEVSGPGFRADVLVEGKGWRLAFEVQLSRQSPGLTELRSETFRAAGVEPVWLFTVLPEMTEGSSVQIVQLSTPEITARVICQEGELSLHDFVYRTLQRYEPIELHSKSNEEFECPEFPHPQSLYVERSRLLLPQIPYARPEEQVDPETGYYLTGQRCTVNHSDFEQMIQELAERAVNDRRIIAERRYRNGQEPVELLDVEDEKARLRGLTMPKQYIDQQ